MQMPNGLTKKDKNLITRPPIHYSDKNTFPQILEREKKERFSQRVDLSKAGEILNPVPFELMNQGMDGLFGDSMEEKLMQKIVKNNLEDILKNNQKNVFNSVHNTVLLLSLPVIFILKRFRFLR